MENLFPSNASEVNAKTKVPRCKVPPTLMADEFY
jgi:hypothetical protein